MAGAFTTLAILDGGGVSRTMRVWDESGTGAGPFSFVNYGVATLATSALAASLVLKASAGALYGFDVAADSALSMAPWWLMIFNAASAPADGAVTPAKVYAFPAGTLGYAASWGIAPLPFSTGITLVVSTTGPFTKTGSAHA